MYKRQIDDRWYKADYMGYEGLSEVLVSDLLQKSTCPFPFVEYDAAVIEYNGKMCIRDSINVLYPSSANFQPK